MCGILSPKVWPSTSQPSAMARRDMKRSTALDGETLLGEEVKGAGGAQDRFFELGGES